MKEATIKNHPKLNRGERVKIVEKLSFNCYKIAPNLNHTLESVTYFAHKNELYIPEMTKEDWNDIANGRD